MTNDADVYAVAESLRDAWEGLAGSSEDARAAVDDLIRRYSEPGRRYHDLSHVAYVLARIDELGGAADDEIAVSLAAFFHDAVYDVATGEPDADGSDGNEKRSAALAQSSLARLGEQSRAPEVARLVRLTATHAPGPDDRNGAVLCDADLSILGSGPAEYAAYAAAVREEYAHVDDALFAQGRSAVLSALLARPAIFSTQLGSERWEARARRNLETELALLSSQTG